MVSDSGLRVFFLLLSSSTSCSEIDDGGGSNEAGGRGQHGCGLTPPWMPTCPCLRRRPESEVLVGCSAASVSEASLAFCCVGRLKNERTHKHRTESERRNFQPEPPSRGSRMNEVDLQTTSSPSIQAARLPTGLADPLYNFNELSFIFQPVRVRPDQSVSL